MVYIILGMHECRNGVEWKWVGPVMCSLGIHLGNVGTNFFKYETFYIFCKIPKQIIY